MLKIGINYEKLEQFSLLLYDIIPKDYGIYITLQSSSDSYRSSFDRNVPYFRFRIDRLVSENSIIYPTKLFCDTVVFKSKSESSSYFRVITDEIGDYLIYIKGPYHLYPSGLKPRNNIKNVWDIKSSVASLCSKTTVKLISDVPIPGKNGENILDFLYKSGILSIPYLLSFEDLCDDFSRLTLPLEFLHFFEGFQNFALDYYLYSGDSQLKDICLKWNLDHIK